MTLTKNTKNTNFTSVSIFLLENNIEYTPLFNEKYRIDPHFCTPPGGGWPRVVSPEIPVLIWKPVYLER